MVNNNLNNNRKSDVSMIPYKGSSFSLYLNTFITYIITYKEVTISTQVHSTNLCRDRYCAGRKWRMQLLKVHFITLWWCNGRRGAALPWALLTISSHLLQHLFGEQNISGHLPKLLKNMKLIYEIKGLPILTPFSFLVYTSVELPKFTRTYLEVKTPWCMIRKVGSVHQLHRF